MTSKIEDYEQFDDQFNAFEEAPALQHKSSFRRKSR